MRRNKGVGIEAYSPHLRIATARPPPEPRRCGGFTANGTIDRTQYGMNYGAPVVGTEVSFRIEVEASAET